jgi:hypothetical protein
MALQLPAMKKLGEDLGISMEGGLADVVDAAMGHKPAQPDPADRTPGDAGSESDQRSQ